MSKKINNLFVNPQGIGDLAIPLKYFLINFLKNSNYKNYFIIQYKSQKIIIEKYCITEVIIFFSKIFYNLNFKNISKIISLSKKKFENVFIDPNINIVKAIILSLIVKSNKKIYKKFFLHNIFFDDSPSYDPIRRKEYYDKLNKKYNSINYELTNKKNNKLKKNIIEIAPGTGILEKHKRWPWKKFVEFINKLEKPPEEIYLFGNENDILKLISKNLKLKCRFINYQNINKSLEKLFDIKFLLTNDNGIANFAAIYGIKTYILSGPNIPETIKNFQNVKLISRNIECSPCYKKMRFGCGNPVCLTKLSVEKVIKNIH
tara:strand:- start:123 stop:1073 length:951 start_codon:yes stop_codon:yes gene_type:complete